jgi:hypothetical protein
MVELSIVAGYFLVGTIWGTTNAAMEIGTQKKEEEEKKMAEKGMVAEHGGILSNPGFFVPLICN